MAGGGASGGGFGLQAQVVLALQAAALVAAGAALLLNVPKKGVCERRTLCAGDVHGCCISHGCIWCTRRATRSQLNTIAVDGSTFVPCAGELERGCMPALMQQQLLMWAGLLTSGLGACYWLYAHHAMVSKYGRELGAR